MQHPAADDLVLERSPGAEEPSLGRTCETDAPQGAAFPRAFIVSNVRLVREALAQSLARSPRLAIVGVGAAHQPAIAEAIAARPNVVLLDMSTSTNYDLARAIIAAVPCVKVIAFAVTDIDRDVIACAQSGMAGYVSRDGTLNDLVAAVEHAMRGELRCSPRIAAMLFGRVGSGPASAAAAAVPDTASLTRRQREICRLICDGLSNKAIARELGLSIATVKNHVHIILGKLQVSRRGEAAARLYDRSTSPPQPAQ